MTNINYNKKTFLEGNNNTIIADNVEVGMILLMNDGSYFYVDDIDKFFLNKKVALLYDDYDNVNPKHTIINFYADSYQKTISDIPGTAKLIAYQNVTTKK